VELYGIFAGLFASIGAMVVMQAAVVGEKRSGTAAWVLSKPATRAAFIVAKLGGNAAGFLVASTLVPGLVAFAELSLLVPATLDPGRFAAAIGVLMVHQLFYLALTLMLGTVFNGWGPVIAIPIAFSMAQQTLLGLVPGLLPVLPWTLFAPLGNAQPSITGALILGGTPASWLPLPAACVLAAVFVAIALWRFSREEF
jgi:ABC-2 type transport system permease protein